LSASEAEPKLYLTKTDQEWGVHYCKKRGLTEADRSKAIVVHPGSGSKKKRWPLERFVEVVSTLQDEHGVRVVVVRGPAEGPETERAFEGRGIGPCVPVLLKDLSLIELASAIEGCHLFIGNDSGITHMAAALGLPTLAIFGPSASARWAPRGRKVLVLQRNVPCSPCGREKLAQCEEITCLRAVEVEDVLKEVERMEHEERLA
jgi:ADP-heptose:LPS heptosyltransferase